MALHSRGPRVPGLEGLGAWVLEGEDPRDGLRGMRWYCLGLDQTAHRPQRPKRRHWKRGCVSYPMVGTCLSRSTVISRHI